jgi:ACS family D-galactonate transporter-like MFS transporter
MTPTSESRPLAKFGPALFLLTVSFIINYVDRGNISVAGPLIKKDFHLSDSELGVLFSAFFFTYTAMQFLIGWLVDRFDANWILAGGFLLWSLATATTGIVRGFTILLIVRFILGIGESVALPCGSKILAENLPEHYRGFASGCVMSGLKWGNVIGTIGAGFLMADFGWRPIFVAVGLISLLWLPAWISSMPRCDRPSLNALKLGPGFSDILSQRSFWGTSAGHFATNYLFYFLLTWLPTYLVLERHLSIKRMAVVAGLCYGVDALSAISTGWLQDFAILRGHTPTLVRKSAMVIGFSMAAIGLLGCALAANSYIPWLLAAGFGCGMTGPGLYTFPQTLAGSAAVGKWYGWQNGFANFAGITGPALTGFVLQYTGKFFAPFAITAAICVGGSLAWVLLVGRVEEVKWTERRIPALAISNVDG